MQKNNYWVARFVLSLSLSLARPLFRSLSRSLLYFISSVRFPSKRERASVLFWTRKTATNERISTSRRVASRLTALISSAASRICVYVIVNAPVTSATWQSDLKSVSHPRRARALYHAAAYCYADEMMRSPCNIARFIFTHTHTHTHTHIYIWYLKKYLFRDLSSQ